MIDAEDLAVLFMLASTALFVSNLVFVGLWIRARERALRPGVRFDREVQPIASASENATRQEHLEQAVEAIAVEVERIAEGQRFVTKLLAERGSTVERQYERVITPH